MVRDLSLTFPKEVRDSAEVTRSRRGIIYVITLALLLDTKY